MGKLSVRYDPEFCRTVIDGEEYSETDIRNWELEEFRTSSIQLRKKLGVRGSAELLKEQNAATRKMWEDAYATSEGKIKIASTEMWFKGITLKELNAYNSKRDTFAIHPCHYGIEGVLTEGMPGKLVGMEAQGYQGTTMLFTLKPADPKDAPFDYPKPGPGGEVWYSKCLFEDGTYFGNEALHVLEDTPEGLHVILHDIMPANIPDFIGEGHKIHFAIEFYNGALAAVRYYNSLKEKEAEA